MKKLFFILLLFITGCLDLDLLIKPVIYNPKRLTEYQLGHSTEKPEIGDYNIILPDSTLDNYLPEYSFEGPAGKLYGYFLGHTGNELGITIFYCHGNTNHLDNYWPRSKLLYSTGYNVFTFDYRGFGKSEGDITETGMLEDSERALGFVLNTLAIPPENILLYGFSLGTVPVTHLAAHYPGMEEAVGLVLEAPVGSTEIYIQDTTYLSFPYQFITGYKLDNIINIKNVYVPLLWLHGLEDTQNHWKTQGFAVYNNYPGSIKYQKLVEGAAHSHIPLGLGGVEYSVYISGIRDFIEGRIPFQE